MAVSTAHRNRPAHAARRVPSPAREAPRARSCSSRSSAAGSDATRSSARGSRIVGFEEAETLGVPVVGYLGYEASPGSSRRCRCPQTGRGLPESRFVVAETLVRFDHARGVAEVLVGDADEVARRLDGDPRLRATRPARRGAAPPLARPSDVRAPACARAKEHIRAGDVFQVVLSQRAERPTSASRARALPRAAPGQSVAVPLPARAREVALIGSSPETLVKLRGRPRQRLNPIAGTITAGRRRRGAAARLGEGPRRARDARRPRPERPLARLRRRLGARRALHGAERFSHVTHLVSEVVGRAARRRDAVRAPARVLPGRHGVRRAEDARNAD